MKIFNCIIALLGISLLISSCKDDPATTTYNVRLTDGPGPYTAVNIDLQSVEITGNGGSTVTLNTTAGIYNLLSLSNGLDTLIATGGLELSSVQQIRLILGTNNSIVVNNQTYPLSTPSADQSGLKLQVHHELLAGVAYEVLLDFDASKSIVETGNGQYKLKPVIRTIENAISGSIKGRVLPSGVLAVVEASGLGGSYSTTVNSEGKFIIKGLPAGVYTVVIIPVAPYIPATVNTVNVTIGNTTDVGSIQL